MLESPDKISITKATAEKIIHVLEEHVQDFSCDHSIDLCFCKEREIIQDLKQTLEQSQYNIKVLHAI